MIIKRNSRLFFIFLYAFILEFSFVSPAAAEEKIINYIINTDESTVVDQILYHALQRIGYGMTMDAMPMNYAIQMANSGERDALAVHAAGTELTYTNLVMVPEEIVKVGFQVYVREGEVFNIRSWDDLSGLIVGHLFQKARILRQLPKDIAGSIQRETFYDLNLALLAGECDLIVTTSTFDRRLISAEGVVYLTTIDVTSPVTFVNKKFASIVPEFTNSLAEMKADGTYDKIVNGQWRTQERNQIVLHISSFYAEDLWDARFKDGIMSALSAQSDVSYFNVPLYSNRFRSEYEQARNAYFSLRTMIMTNPPDVIIASDRSAVSFVCNYYSTLFENTPVIIYDINGEIDQLWQLGGNYTAIWETIPAEETVMMIQNLFPNTNELFIINDYSANGAAFKSGVERILGNSFNGLNIAYNDNIPHNSLLSVISSLSENTAIIIGHYLTDADGIYIPRTHYNSIVSANINIPVFGILYGSIGTGQIGGKYIDPIYYGEAAGKIALEIIQGIRDGNFSVQNDAKLPAMIYDTKEYSKWVFDEEVILSRRINRNLLPRGADFINHKPSLYESNPQLFRLIVFTGLLGIILIIGLSIGIFVIQQKNRNILENTITISEQAEELNNLENILNSLNVMVCITDHKTDELLFLNDFMKSVLGVEDDWAGKKCYKVLRKFDKRCDFCPCPKLAEGPDKVIIWEQYHTLTNRIYRSYSRYIKWPGGKIVHLQNSLDITDLKANAKILDKRLEQQVMMTDISRSFLSNENIDELINKALKKIGEFMGIEQILLLRLDNNGTRLICRNEWIKPSANKSSRIGTAMLMSDTINDLLDVIKKYNKNYFTADEPGVKAIIEPFRINYQNFLMTSVLIEDVMYAALDFSRADNSKWSREEINTASLFTNIVTSVLQKHVLKDQLIKAKENASWT